MINLKGKKALIVGIANEHSIAWGAARAMREAGAELAVTYLNAKADPFVRPLAESLQAEIIQPLDVRQPDQEAALLAVVGQKWGKLDILVHSIAFAPMEDLHNRVCDVTQEGFAVAMDISVHSFIRLVRCAEPFMQGGGACMAMSYLGAERVVSTYNLMGPVKAALESVVRELASELGPSGVTVNALSPGPILTRAASGIDHFDDVVTDAVRFAPMRRLATIEEVGGTAAFLASDEARAITGSVIHVDCGRHIMA